MLKCRNILSTCTGLLLCWELVDGNCEDDFITDKFSYLAIPDARVKYIYNDNLPEHLQHSVPWAFKHARKACKECSDLGGRFWEAEVLIDRYMDDMHSHNSSLPDRFARKLKWRMQTDYLSNEELRFCLCAPSSCEAEDVGKLLHHYLARKIRMGRLPQVKESSMGSVAELWDWSKLELDFVIGGIDNCGTNSVWRNLQLHPSIGWLSDTFFAGVLHRRLLPLRSQLEEHSSNLHHAKLKGAMANTIPTLPIAQLALASLPNLQVFLMTCDPVTRLEKHFMYYHSCETAELHAPLRVEGQPCYFRLGELLSKRPDFHESARMGKYIATMKKSMGQRLKILHQSWLREKPLQFYNQILESLGESEHFTAETPFKRYNHHPGDRSELCQDPSLQSFLKRMLDTDYREISSLFQEAGKEIPADLRLRRIRCNRSTHG